MIATSALLSYFPSIRVGFLGDDWWFLGKAASLSLPEYLTFYFDPAQQIFWYRPIYGILLLIEYWIFGASPEGYHVGQILLHLLNALLLFAIIWRLALRWRLALIAAVFFATIPVHSEAVFWIAVQDPLGVLFYLAAIWFWVGYLETRQRRAYVLTMFAFVLALLGKETNVFLPGILFLIERLILGKKTRLKELVTRYAPFAIILAGYLLIEYRVQAIAYFPNRWGYGIGWHVVENAARYLALLAFPYELNVPLSYLWLAASLAVMGISASQGQWRVFVVLGAHALLAVLPATFFPTMFFYPRYLYSATLVSGVLFALLVEFAWSRWACRHWTHPALAAILGLLLVTNVGQTVAAAEAEGEMARQFRVPLRDIYQQHLTYPPDTYLYLIEYPYPYILRNLTGMFYLRYGSNVTVWSTDAEFGGWDENRFANLREYKNAWVYYLDDNRQRHEIPVQRDAAFKSSLQFPLDYAASIRLEGFEATASSLPRGGDLAVLLYWNARGYVDRDYTVFAHLVDEHGEIVLSDDAQPRGGRAPTSKWRPSKLVVDAHILTLPSDLPRGSYRLEIGMYYLPTLERLQFVDENGKVIADTAVIEGFTVTE